MVEEISDDESLVWSELEGMSDGSWVEGEFARESVDWSDGEEFAVEEIVSVTKPTTTRVEIFDSGATTHISPYREDFSSFNHIPLKTLHAVNKQGFNAVGKGELVLDLPNGSTSSHSTLARFSIALTLDILLYLSVNLMTLVFQPHLQMGSALSVMVVVLVWLKFLEMEGGSTR